MLRPFGEKHRLILWLSVLLGAAFAISSLASYFVSRNSIRHEIIANELPLTVDNVYSEIQRDLVRPILISSLMAHDTFLRNWSLNGERDTRRIAEYLKEIQVKFDALTCFFVSERSHTYYFENGFFKKISQADSRDAWYWRVRKMAAPYEINVDLDQAHGDALTIFINYRLTDRDGVFLGATGIGLTVNSVRKMVDNYQKHYHRTVYFTDRQGRILLHGDGARLPDSIRAMDGLRERADTILSQPAGSYQYVRNDRVRQLNVRYLPELGWYLFVEKAEDEDLANIYHTLLLNLAISAAATLVALLLTHLSISYHQKRFKATVDKHTAELNVALSEASSANQSKSQVLAYISHDLRAPLSNIIRNIKLLDLPSPDRHRKNRTAIEQSTQHLIALIDELVEYARGELGYFELLPAPNYLYAFLDEIAHEAGLLARQHDNRFSMALTGDIPAVAVFDPKRLRQVLINLLANAAKFVSGGEIHFRVQVLAGTTADRSTLRFVVEDTGPGIAEKDRQRIFEPFQRIGAGRPGSGLGLAIAHQLVAKMGGELRLETPPSRGSRFVFDLEVESARESDVLHPANAFSIPNPIGTGKRLLLVCDAAENSDFLYEMLSLADFHVVRAHDTETALQLDSEGRFDAVVTDHVLPEIDGWELLRHLRQRHADAPVRVVLHSAQPPRRPVDFPAWMEFDATLLKPADMDNLLPALHVAPAAEDARPAPTENAALLPEHLPIESLIALRGLIDQGDFTGIEDWLAACEEDHSEQPEFTARIKEAAQLLDFDRLAALVGAAIESRSKA
jgi:signal transduction histidine kinase/DNA-binding NarL/FixJ family response regulator